MSGPAPPDDGALTSLSQDVGPCGARAASATRVPPKPTGRGAREGGPASTHPDSPAKSEFICNLFGFTWSSARLSALRHVHET